MSGQSDGRQKEISGKTASYDFGGRVALITGAGSGIGRATALAFADNGARVVVADVRADAGQATAESIRASGSEAICVTADVSSAADVTDLVAAALSTFGRLDFAHNNAGISSPRVPTGETTEADFDRVVAVNLKGVWLCMKFEIERMLTQGHGVIVNTASTLGLIAQPGSVAYVAAKHGVIGMTKTAALEYSSRGIRVNAVCPGVITSPLVSESLSQPDRAAMLVGLHPIGRLGTPEEVAAAVIWLASDAASFVTGTSLVVDGGWVAH